jgi:alpha-1,3-rhamnosyl/mannosyltransferase
MKIALSILCENPKRRTGLTTLFYEFVARGIRLFPDIEWLVFAGPNQKWSIAGAQIEIINDYPANDQLQRRLLADHFRVPPAARRHGADVLITTGFVPLRKSLPIALQIFSLQHLDAGNKIGLGRALYRNWMMKYSWPRADLIITNSQCAAAQVLSAFPESKGKLVQSYEGLQHEEFNPTLSLNETARLKERFGIEPGYFLWISNFYPYKQPELLVKGYARLDLDLRRRHPLVMAGGNWIGTLERVQLQARALGIAAEVKFLDWVEDEWLAPLYRQALAFCLPSREETFGRCVIESMACGAPCIVNDIPVMREVADGCALIVDFNDTALLAEALKRMACDAGTRARLRQAGLERAQQFSFEKLTTERVTAIERLVAARQAGLEFKLQDKAAATLPRDD